MPGPMRPRTSGLAVASMVMGILGFVLGWLCCGLIFPLLAVVFGHVAYAQINGDPTQWKGRGMAVAGLVLGYVGLAFSVLLGLVSGMFSLVAGAL